VAVWPSANTEQGTASDIVIACAILLNTLIYQEGLGHGEESFSLTEVNFQIYD